MASSAIPAASSFRLSSAMDRTGQWVLSQEVPTDLVVQVGETCVPLHRFMLVAKSGYIRRKVLESAAAASSDQVTHLDLSPIPGGADAFDRAAKFCYGVNFEISVHNVAALRCAAEFLEMTDKYFDGNLASRTEEFLSKAALRTLSGAIAVLKSCEELIPAADELRIVQRCVDAISLKACNESNFPTRSPPEWWASELTGLAPFSLQKILAAIKARGASPRALGAVISAYADKSLPLSGAGPPSALAASDLRSRLESIAGLLLPAAGKDAALPVGFLCRLLRSAIFLEASAGCRKELEKRISAVLGEATVGDLVTVAFEYSGERVADLESVRRIVAEFAEREVGGIMGGFFGGGVSAAVQRVARVVDAFVGEIATDAELSVSKFAGIAGALPKAARRSDDDLYRAVDIYLKAHPELDEIEREKVCSVMDPLRLSYEARLHASQNKRLPLQIVLHALYYDQLKLRSGGAATAGDDQPPLSAAASARGAAAADSSLMRENEALRSELSKMKLYLADLQKTGGGGGGGGGTPGSSRGTKKSSSFGLFSSVSRTLGKLKLNPFKGASKDTSNIDVEAVAAVEVTKPKRRRFSIS